jgi:hypothetical protein
MSSHPGLPLSVGLGGAPIGPICRSELCREQSPLGTLDIFFDGLLIDIADWFELLPEHRQRRTQVDEAPGLCARAYGAVIPIAGSRSMLPIRFLNGPDNYDARLLSLESPTPRARTYADRLSENSREMTLVAEAALRGHIR